ncbi:MAG: hypothetical protein BGO68_05465 [Candidatus Amoebophilus sp. 36-38]|nr:MAG: hypothetical protein BGO68_05465 [Candidatus Amoebophilus sp. 36-38]
MIEARKMKKYLLTCIVAVSCLLQSCNTDSNQLIPKGKKQGANEKLAKSKLATTSFGKHSHVFSRELNKEFVGKRKRENKKEKQKTKRQSKTRRIEVENEHNENIVPPNTNNREKPKGKKRNNGDLKPTFTNNSKANKVDDLDAKEMERQSKIRRIEIERREKEIIALRNKKEQERKGKNNRLLKPRPTNGKAAKKDVSSAKKVKLWDILKEKKS